MADWSDRAISTRYRFVRVDRRTGHETGAIPALKGGTVTRNDDVRIKESAEVGLFGSVDFGPDLVRVYMQTSWLDGTSKETVLGTFLPVIPGRTVNAGYATSTLKMYGRLQELLDDSFGTPVTISKGENAIARARAVCESAGLTVVSDPSSYTVTDTRVYGVGVSQNNSEIGDTKLDMVNDLLDLAGFRVAYTDPMGRVRFTRHRDPYDIAPSWSFEEGPRAKFEASMTEERDYTSAANHVVVVYGTAESGGTVVGEAWDRDPSSTLSTVTRGRTITKVYTYTDLPPGKNDAERRSYAARRAQTLLSTAQSVIWRVSIRNAYAPISVNDTVNLKFPSGGIDGKFQVRTQTLRLSGGCPTDTELRQFRRRS